MRMLALQRTPSREFISPSIALDVCVTRSVYELHVPFPVCLVQIQLIAEDLRE